MTFPENNAFLVWSSYAGISGDATHVYGKLWYKGERMELRQPLTREMAEALDKKDGNGTYKRALKYQENPTTERFDTFEELNKFAASVARKLGAEFLLTGRSYAAADAQEVIYAPEGINTLRLNEIAKRIYQLDAVYDEQEYDALNREYSKLINADVPA